MVEIKGIIQPDEFFAGNRSSEGLATLTCFAAQELDEHSLGRAKSYEHVDHLARIMPQTLADKGRLVPTTILILGSALQKHTGKGYSEVDEVINRTAEFAERLRNAKTASQQEAADLRGYCLALSRELREDADFSWYRECLIRA